MNLMSRENSSHRDVQKNGVDHPEVDAAALLSDAESVHSLVRNYLSQALESGDLADVTPEVAEMEGWLVEDYFFNLHPHSSPSSN